MSFTLAAIPLALVVALPLRTRTSSDPGAVYDGRSGHTRVSAPRIERADSRIDGILDEAPWSAAARLVGFSQFYPTDGAVPADSTIVLVWYAPDAIHVGIRAYEA